MKRSRGERARESEPSDRRSKRRQRTNAASTDMREGNTLRRCSAMAQQRRRGERRQKAERGVSKQSCRPSERKLGACEADGTKTLCASNRVCVEKHVSLYLEGISQLSKHGSYVYRLTHLANGRNGSRYLNEWQQGTVRLSSGCFLVANDRMIILKRSAGNLLLTFVQTLWRMCIVPTKISR